MFLENIKIIVRLIQVYANNIIFTLKIRLCYKLLIISIFMLFFHLYKIFFDHFFCFIICNNVYTKYCQRFKKDVSPWNQRLYLCKLLSTN